MKKTTCRLTAGLLIVAALLVFAGCGGDEKSSSGSGSEVDVDLTTLSSTMVYSEVNNMVNSPDDYVGKTVKMKGAAASFYDETAKETYYACIIKDATACCSQGLEYVLKDGDNYPPDNEEITVVGEFRKYTAEDGTPYFTLANATRL